MCKESQEKSQKIRDTLAVSDIKAYYQAFIIKEYSININRENQNRKQNQIHDKNGTANQQEKFFY